jgi:hypothetical protein
MPAVEAQKMTSSQSKSASLFKNIPLFIGMADDVIEGYAKIATAKSYKKGQVPDA